MPLLILQWSIRAVFLAIGTGLVLGLLRPQPASALHRAWTAAMIAMLLLPAWTQWGPSWTARILPSAGTPIHTPGIEPAFRPSTIPLASAVPAGAAGAPSFPIPQPAPVAPTLLLVYLAGVAVMLARLIAGTWRIRSILRQARAAEGFLMSPLCSSPVTIGWWRPVLILPECWRSWPAAKLDAVLLHEREHVRRRDPLFQWLALLNRCVFWFHPLAWWLEHKLAALAEQACDDAVLCGGHDAHDYSQYLIEIARAVRESGPRIRSAGAVAFSDGSLARRVRRILAAPPVAPSRGRSIATAVLCALMILTFLACKLSNRRPVAGGDSTLSMSEQARRSWAGFQQLQRARQWNDAEIWDAVRGLTPDRAKQLDADLIAHPEDLSPLTVEDRGVPPPGWNRLLVTVRYYQAKSDLKALDTLTFWLIEHNAQARLDWGYRPIWDKAWDAKGYDRGKQLWTARLQQPIDSPYVYMNAAEFLADRDIEMAEPILQEGRRRYPSAALHWEVFLGRLYAWALLGAPGPLPDSRLVGLAAQDAPPAQSAYAQKVRTMLLGSDDLELLDRTVEALQGNRPSHEFAQSMIGHMLSIKPNDRDARMRRANFQLAALEERAASPAALSEADQFALLQDQLQPHWLWHFDPNTRRRVLADPAVIETKARNLLSWARRNSEDTDYGAAIFLANMALGVVAMNRGDKDAAAQDLISASEAPATEFMRITPIDMTVARELVDAGERDAMAKFLDRCAAFNFRSKELQDWATQIRKGKNPNLIPYHD